MLLFFFSTNAVFAPLRVAAQKSEDIDWSELFPEFPGCQRTIQPLVRTGETSYQTAVYKPQNPEKFNPPTYYGCGTIALRYAPGERKTETANFKPQLENPFFRKRKIKSFDAYTVTPLCGNDDSSGSTRVYFDEDKVLIISAMRGAGNLLEFAETADYDRLKSAIDEFVKRQSEF